MQRIILLSVFAGGGLVLRIKTVMVTVKESALPLPVPEEKMELCSSADPARHTLSEGMYIQSIRPS
jgi:hypothetical protein